MIPDYLPASPDLYPAFLAEIQAQPPEKRKASYRMLCKSDLHFLLRYVLSTKQIMDPEGKSRWEHPWLFARCREVQDSPNGHLDLWAREHFKSSIITFGLSIFDILNDPEITIGIFSHSRPIAKRFLRQIKVEMETNKRLVGWFPEILWENPARQSPKWSEDDGIVVQRVGNPACATVEAWGLIDGQPTGKHFRVRVYDDVVDQDVVGTPEMIQKVTRAWELSSNLGMEGGFERYIGTRYHAADTYRTMMDRKAAIPRTYPAQDPPVPTGEPVLFTREYLEKKYKEQGAYTYSSQLLLNPLADATQGFKEEWFQTFSSEPTEERRGKNLYILVDAANEKKRRSDFTAIWVVGLGGDRNYYVLDGYRDRLNLVERTDLLFRLHERWRPLIVRYEQYGLTADIEHVRYVQNQRNYRFHIEPVAGNAKKNDRIRRLIPLFQEKRIFFPEELRHTDYAGRAYDLIPMFKEEEFSTFPVGMHDDLLDALSRIAEPDLPLIWPAPGAWREPVRDAWELPDKPKASALGWMGA